MKCNKLLNLSEKINKIFIFSILIIISSCSTTGVSKNDPLEPMNRAIFGFNEVVDQNVFKPIAKGYKYVTPDPVETGVSNFFSNLGEVSTIANDNSPSIKFKLMKDLVNLSSINNENSTATEDLIAEYKGDEIEIGFNSRYIMDILDNLEGEDVILSFKDNSSPIIIEEKIVSENAYVLMPMRV